MLDSEQTNAKHNKCYYIITISVYLLITYVVNSAPDVDDEMSHCHLADALDKREQVPRAHSMSKTKIRYQLLSRLLLCFITLKLSRCLS